METIEILEKQLEQLKIITQGNLSQNRITLGTNLLTLL